MRALTLSRCLLSALIAFCSDAAFAGEFEQDIRPLIDKYCVRCHGIDKAEAGLEFASQHTLVDVLKSRARWLEAAHQIENEKMPPEGPLPTKEERTRLIEWTNQAVVHANWKQYADAGRVSLARLTEIEYRNSIRDIFGVDLQAGLYLGRDPEGATGFTNDHDNLSFPLFAMQDYLREAERAADAFLSFRQPNWSQSIEMEDAWAMTSDKSAKLTEDGKGIVAENNKAPFHFGVTLPHSGMYRLEIHASVFDGEPISGLEVMSNGCSIARLVIEKGDETRVYNAIANLAAGFNSITLVFDPERAPLIQPRNEPIAVPLELENRVRSQPAPHFAMPPKFKGNKDAEQSFKRFNNVIADFHYETQLSMLLIKRDEADYDANSFMNFRPTKVPFNIAAGKIAVLMKIPQKQLEQQLKKQYNFDEVEHATSTRAYKSAWEKKYPDRVKKIPGKVAVDRVVVSNRPPGIGDSEPIKLMIGIQDPEDSRQLIEKLAATAYRRPPTTEQIRALHAIYRDTLTETGSQIDALRDALIGMLVSPQFLLHFTPGSESKAAPVDGFELASRLSYFLWLTIPDETLRSMTTTSKVVDEPVILDQVLMHLISSPKFDAFCQTFVEQWLNLQTLEGVDINLVEAMRAEPVLLLREIIRDNRSLLDLIDAKHTWLNEVLAHHYGIEGVKGTQMRSVKLTTDQRGGLLAMGGVLLATSTADRTSPVARGAWIVETLLGEKLPLPPPSVPELKTNVKTRTVREELELHRQSSQCAGCHNRIDPYGFLLEHYDRLGMWRNKEGNHQVKSSTTLEDGTQLDGLSDFKQHLRTRRAHDFSRSVTERMLEFALGRELQYHDESLLEVIIARLKADDWRAQTLLREIIRSDAFQKQNDTRP